MSVIKKIFISFYSTMFLILLLVGFITNTKQYLPIEVGFMLLLFLMFINFMIHESMAEKYIKREYMVQNIARRKTQNLIGPKVQNMFIDTLEES